MGYCIGPSQAAHDHDGARGLEGAINPSLVGSQSSPWQIKSAQIPAHQLTPVCVYILFAIPEIAISLSMSFVRSHREYISVKASHSNDVVSSGSSWAGELNSERSSLKSEGPRNGDRAKEDRKELEFGSCAIESRDVSLVKPFSDNILECSS